MSTAQCLRTFVNERLTAAAEEILGVFEKTIEAYEEEIDRQRRLLDAVLKPQLKRQRTDSPQPSVIKEEVLLDQQHWNQERNSSLDQEDPEPPQIKEEQEEDQSYFIFSPTYDGSDHSEHQSLHSDPYQTLSVAENEPPANISPEADRAHTTASEAHSDRQLLSQYFTAQDYNTHSSANYQNAGSTWSTESKPPYKCNTCSNEFSNWRKLKSHMASHTKKMSFKCRICGKGSSCKSHHDQHVRIHTGEKPYACNTCGKRFSRSADLKKHNRVHTGEKPYSCIYCEKRFADRSSHITHLRLHTGEKPYKCIFCEKSFAISSSLKLHSRTHTGEKPYKCSICGNAFTYSLGLKAHMRIHTGEKPYKCDTCGEMFMQKSSLNKHMRTHIE